jgi:hypothetical protein
MRFVVKILCSRSRSRYIYYISADSNAKVATEGLSK